jgi:hypothetical protein
MESGEVVESGEWRMESGEWRMEDGEWRMESGEWKSVGARVWLSVRGSPWGKAGHLPFFQYA